MNHLTRIIRKPILISTLVLMSSGVALAKDKINEVKPGMTSKEVQKLMGKPKLRNFTKEVEQWQYRLPNSDPDGANTRILATITFEEGIVTALTTEEVELTAEEVSRQEAKAEALSATAALLHTLSEDLSASKKPHRGKEMSSSQFDTFCKNVKSRSFDKDKLEEVRMGAANQYLTCKQCAELLTLFSFDSNRFEAFNILAPKVIDKENYKLIENSFSFESNRRKVHSVIAATASNGSRESVRRGGGTAAMNDDKFNQLVANLKSCINSEDRLHRLQTATRGNYFSCHQCATLVELFIPQSQRMKVVESVANGIVDNEHYQLVERTFVSSSDKKQVRIALGIE